MSIEEEEDNGLALLERDEDLNPDVGEESTEVTQERKQISRSEKEKEKEKEKYLTKQFSNLPEDQQEMIFEILNMTDNKQRKKGLEAFKEAVKYRPPARPTVNSKHETYPQFKTRTGSKDGKECLKKNWGKWLKAFNPELKKQGIDYLHKGHLRNLDPKLMKRLEQMYTKEEIALYIPTKEIYGDQRAKTMTEEQIQTAIENRNIVVSKNLTILVA